MTTHPATTPDTEIVTNTFMGVDPQEILRSIPRDAGIEKFSGQPVKVCAVVGHRPQGHDGPFKGGPYISIAEVIDEDEHTWCIDLSESDAFRLAAAIILAVGDLETIREATTS